MRRADGAGVEVLLEAIAIAEPSCAAAGRGGVGEPLHGASVIPAGELVLLVAALLVAGLVAGFLAGLLGIGGGGVLVPVLYEVFRILDVDPGDPHAHGARHDAGHHPADLAEIVRRAPRQGLCRSSRC